MRLSARRLRKIKPMIAYVLIYPRQASGVSKAWMRPEMVICRRRVVHAQSPSRYAYRAAHCGAWTGSRSNAFFAEAPGAVLDDRAFFLAQHRAKFSQDMLWILIKRVAKPVIRLIPRK